MFRFVLFFHVYAPLMAPKKYTKTAIVRFPAHELASACKEWGVAWQDGEDDLEVKARLFKKIRCNAQPALPPSGRCFWVMFNAPLSITITVITSYKLLSTNY